MHTDIINKLNVSYNSFYSYNDDHHEYHFSYKREKNQFACKIIDIQIWLFLFWLFCTCFEIIS